MGLELIKELHELTRNKSDAEKALEEAGIDFDLGGEESAELSDINGGDDMGEEADPELQRLADDLRDQAEEMDDDQLQDLVGDELEQLEYQPDEMYDAICTVMELLGRQAEDDESEDYGDEGDFADELA